MLASCYSSFVLFPGASMHSSFEIQSRQRTGKVSGSTVGSSCHPWVTNVCSITSQPYLMSSNTGFAGINKKLELALYISISKMLCLYHFVSENSPWAEPDQTSHNCQSLLDHWSGLVSYNTAHPSRVKCANHEPDELKR